MIKESLWKRASNGALGIAATAYGLFHLYYSTLASISESWRNSIHIGGAMAFLFVFAARDTENRVFKTVFYILALLSAAVPLYVIGMEEALFARNDQMITSDLWVAGGTLILVLIAVAVGGG